MSETIVKIFNRERGSNDPTPWQADIFTADGHDHHGIAKTPAVALLRAARHWVSYDPASAEEINSGTPS
jgi:hypothetical protein